MTRPDAVVVVLRGGDTELEGLREQLVEMIAQRSLDRARALEEARRRRALEHRMREVENRLLALEAVPPKTT